MEVTHIRKMNYINWIQDVFRLFMIGSILIVIDVLAMTTIISDDTTVRMFLSFSQTGYILFYMAKLITKNDTIYWTYIEVKQSTVDN